MEIILYITGGIALLAIAWLFISLAKTISGVLPLLAELIGNLSSVVTTMDDLKTQITPILGNMAGISSNVKSITSNVNHITTGLQNQMAVVHDTIDDALDIVRGTLDDIERLKDDVVATVAVPVSVARSATTGAIGTGVKVVNLLWKLFGNRRRRNSVNGKSRREK